MNRLLLNNKGGHYHSRSSGCKSNPIIPFIIIIVLIVINAIIKPDIRGKYPLNGNFETYPSYLIDDKGYFTNSKKLISGLEYLL